MGRPRKTVVAAVAAVGDTQIPAEVSVASGDVVSYPTITASETPETVDTIVSQHKDAVEETRKPRRGRPRKQKTVVEEPEDSQKAELVESYSALGGMMLDVICPRLPNPIPASMEERKLFGDAVARVMLKYAPAIGGYDAEIALVLSCALILTPRIVKPRQ